MTLPRDLDFSLLCEQTRTAAREAGAIIRSHWDQPRDIRLKGRIDLVTQTDLAVEKALRVSLAALLPEAGFLAEETASEAPLKGLTWVVDPLDGTTNYAHSLPFVAVSIGLWREGKIMLGVVFNPILDELFWAVRGQGAWLGNTPIRVSAAETLEESLVATGFPYTAQEKAATIVAWLELALTRCQGVRRYGAAALDLAYVACGRLDAFYEGWLKPWDTAAGWLLVEEAGGMVTPFAVDAPYDLRSETLLATNGRVHAAMGAMLDAAPGP